MPWVCVDLPTGQGYDSINEQDFEMVAEGIVDPTKVA
jgi:hypothetical protein